MRKIFPIMLTVLLPDLRFLGIPHLNSSSRASDSLTNRFLMESIMIPLPVPGYSPTFCRISPQRHERNRELLQNLRCPSLTHFKWHKDAYMQGYAA
ncbi:hypothetical protein GIB67_042584 [Kingdonia uniflora]|uniref:Uncharacterized protein n=1 Tax=Kingdonia uniflora TaxID=39325 RepID=A0A7J7M172_9MAGN|nr:hypothetical protein GIB67_042584 [Kingdonia uniflora]